MSKIRKNSNAISKIFWLRCDVASRTSCFNGQKKAPFFAVIISRKLKESYSSLKEDIQITFISK